MGRAVGKAVAERLGRAILELGGNNGILVTADDTLEVPVFRVDVASGKVTRLTGDGAFGNVHALRGGGVIATMIPYSAEIYPVHLRGTGSGVIAASSKAGGILGAGLGVLGLFGNFTLSAIVIAVPMAISAVMLMRAGIETRGHALEAIQRAMAE